MTAYEIHGRTASPTCAERPELTATAEHLAQKQAAARDALYIVFNELATPDKKLNWGELHGHPRYVAAKTAYQSTVTDLASYHGSNAHCALIDSDLWGNFSDIFKSHHGFRPREHMTVVEVNESLDRMAQEDEGYFNVVVV